eukprot:COSAG05_NODE_66_length_22253_cov_14.954455_4_plen_75_part_00
MSACEDESQPGTRSATTEAHSFMRAEPEAEATKFANLWIPLNAITPEAGNGPLSMISGSHERALPHVHVLGLHC